MTSDELGNVICGCLKELDVLATARPALLKEHLALAGTPGAPWVAACERMTNDGDLAFTATVDLPPNAIDEIRLAEEANITKEDKLAAQSSIIFKHMGNERFATILRNRNPLAPFRNFKLTNIHGERPKPGTAIRRVEMNIEFLLEQVLNAVRSLHIGLVAIEQEVARRGLPVDSTSITTLRLQLPEFPFVPPASIPLEEREAILLADKPLIFEAKLLLHRLALTGTE